jgi:hypothetical protein
MSDGSSSRRNPPQGGLSRSVILLVVTGVVAGIALMLINSETPEQRAAREAEVRLKEVETRLEEIIEAIVNGKFQTPNDYDEFNRIFVSPSNRFDQKDNPEGWRLSPVIVQLFKSCSNVERRFDIRGEQSDRPSISILFPEKCGSTEVYPNMRRFDVELQKVSGTLYLYSARFNPI